MLTVLSGICRPVLSYFRCARQSAELASIDAAADHAKREKAHKPDADIGQKEAPPAPA